MEKFLLSGGKQVAVLTKTSNSPGDPRDRTVAFEVRRRSVAHVKRHAAITGASAGIGAAIAHESRGVATASRSSLGVETSSTSSRPKLGAEVFVVAHDLRDVDPFY